MRRYVNGWIILRERAMPQDANRLIWIDLEMTGLKPDSDRIIEVALVVTDADSRHGRASTGVGGPSGRRGARRDGFVEPGRPTAARA